jgi:predicted lipid carrier protein YhbT
MTDPSTEFFMELQRRGHEPLLRKVKGTIRFEVVHGKSRARWLIEIDRGDVTVSRRNASADSTVRVDHALAERLVTGQANAMAEVLRGRITVEGELEPMILFQRLFPGPPLARRKR